ncbi:hypothetical protein SLS56_002047 [Neofusicoccum ribis]|uniref:RNAse P Rpr2/Rpp21 subunit domain-containing protein n=1 Tax=Neofusicoccum ribis TaxID=45134 RepID=A0ABR3T5X5_9PEZI
MERTAAETRDLSARLKYLHEAAHVLALSSPETSAFLETQYSHLLAENDLTAPDLRKREVCGACGTILIPGLSCSITQETAQPGRPATKRSKVEKRGASKNAKDSNSCKMKIYSCLRCSSKTRLRIPSSKARMDTRRRARASTAETTTSAVNASTQATAPVPQAAAGATGPAIEPSNPAPAAANASSKKRAKARKGGLQAMLANSKKDTSASKGFGLDLMDLMRSE